MTRFDLLQADLILSDSPLTYYELKLYQLLSHNLDMHYKDHYIIYPKVRIGDIITMKRKKNDYSTRARYRARYFDFVICSKDSLQPVLAIELQDKTGKGSYVDALKEEPCKHAGLGFLQLWTTNPSDIKNLLYYRLAPKIISQKNLTIR